MLKNDLFELGIKHKTDKVTHFFLHHYDRLLGHIRNENIRFLEIGVYKGASIRMWREYFPNAEIHCVDINEVDLSDVENVHFHKVDCDDYLELQTLSKKLGEFDIVIDDGGHTMRQQQYAFDLFWPTLKSGGIFILEDLHTSVYQLYPGHNEFKTTTTLEMLNALRKNENFSSQFMTLEKFQQHKLNTNKVEIIWGKQILRNDLDPKHEANVSITSYISKK